MKIKILQDHDLRVKPAVVQAFKAGQTVNLPKQAALKMIQDGIAADLSKPAEEET